MKKIITSIVLAGMLVGSSAAGTIHANSLNQTEKTPVESNHYKLVVEDNFTSWESSIFKQLLPTTSSIHNGTLTLKYFHYGEVFTDSIKVEAGKRYKITLKNVEGNLLVAAMGLGSDLDNYLEWKDNDNHGNNITHFFTAKEPTVCFALVGNPEVSLQGFVLEQIDFIS
ncbi:hypothetical protein P7H25_02365 [Paenibacillus larvae]|nr:hypothetical protein [Paenibacillus larvae]MDT2254722.1 hypothetical protein [Paenibacillus larvae]